MRDLKERDLHRRALHRARCLLRTLRHAVFMDEREVEPTRLPAFSIRSRPARLQPWRRLSSVTPGNTEVVSGEPFTVKVTVTGKAGQPVSIDLWPADDHPGSVKIGSLAGRDPEEFSYQIPKMTTNLDYRVRCG